MVKTLKYDLDTDTTLGGNNASDYIAPSQKAIKSYVDNHSGGGGTATDVQINGTSIVSNNVANIVTNSAYNPSTNKIATVSDVPSVDSALSTTSENPVQNKVITGALPDTSQLSYYGTCSTAAATQAKVVACEGFVLKEGVSIRVKFTNAQTYNGQATLNVNSTGAKGIVTNGTTKSVRYCWLAGEVVSFTYDGTSWIMEAAGIATTTYYGYTKLYTGAGSTSTSTALTPASLNNLVQLMVEPYPIYSGSATYEVGDRVRYGYQAWECITAITTAETWNADHWKAIDPIQTQLDDKQEVLISGTNIKTVNSTSLLGSGNVAVQPTLVSGTNIKTINGNSLLGSGNIEIQGGGTVTVDSALSTISENPVQNKVITTALNNKQGTISDLATIRSGASAGATAVQPDDLATVATSGSYNDLSNKPTIPTVNNATLTIQKNGTTVKTFTANASSNVTCNITVPTKTSDITNDSGYLTDISSSEVTTALGYTPESTSNKVTSISSSSTDTEYPSAKSVVELLKTIYPVGAIFIGTTATCPMSALFGTWELVAEDRCLQGSSTNHSANTTVAAGLPNIEGVMNGVISSGAANGLSCSGAFTLVSHTNTTVNFNADNSKRNNKVNFSATDGSSTIYGQSDTVQPPAYVVNVWRRTA